MTTRKGVGDFEVPPDAKAYISSIVSRVRNLIDSQIWAGMKIERVERWLSNFNDEKSKYFAARILDSLIYRSDYQTYALIDHLFTRCIPEAVEKQQRTGEIKDWISLLKGRDDPHIRIVPVIRDDDPPTKSGPLVTRILKRHLGLNEKWMIWPFKLNEEIKEHGVNTFIFIDDFLGTGTQFQKFTDRNNLKEIYESQLCIYAPLTACSPGINILESEYQDLIVTTSECLSESTNIFSSESDCFNDGINTNETAKAFYECLLEEISGINKEKNRMAYGFGHLGMTYAFSHASPNASIPLLWYEFDDFTPLFDR